MFLLVPAHLGRPGQRAVKQLCVCTCACVCACILPNVVTIFLRLNFFVMFDNQLGQYTYSGVVALSLSESYKSSPR